MILSQPDASVVSNNLPLDQGDNEDTIQAAKYEELCRKIAEAKSRDEDHVCEGAKEISLLRWKTERKAKRVYSSKEPYPYGRRGPTYTLSVETYYRWEAYLVFCGVHGLNPRREAHKYGFGPPPVAIKRGSTRSDGSLSDGATSTPPDRSRQNGRRP